MSRKAGEVTVELRLMMDKLRQDIRKASAEMRTGLAQQMQGAAAATAKTTGEVEKLDKSIKRAASSTKALKDAAVEAWRAQFRAQNPGGPRIVGLTQPQPTQQVAGPGPMIGHATTLKQMGFPLLRKQGFWHGMAPPQLVPPQLAAGWATGGNSLASMWNRAAGWATGGNSLASMWNRAANYQMSPALAAVTKLTAGFGALRLVIGQFKWAMEFVLVPIRALAHQFALAAEQARRLYAKQLQSGGLPGGFVSRRSLLAEALGVLEDEVFQYGRAVDFLNGKVAAASAILARTTPELAAASFEMKALQFDLRAMWAAVAAELSPAVRALTMDLRQLVQIFTPLLAATAKWVTVNMQGLRVLNALSHALQGNFAQALAEIQKLIDSSRAAPDAAASSGRMAASAWERMGLVLGVGKPDWQQETARNTARTAKALELMLRRGMSYTPRSENDQFSGGLRVGWPQP